jgi:hypothetical protein
MKAATRLLVGAGFVLMGGSILMAQTVMRTELNGGEEVGEGGAGVASNAEGRGFFLVYADRIDFTIDTQGFGTDVNAAHIHLGHRGANGPVIVPLFSRQTQGPLPARLSGTIFPTDLVPNPERGLTTFDDLRRAITSGRTYANFHTTLHPGGEIRGQIVPVPTQ